MQHEGSHGMQKVSLLTRLAIGAGLVLTGVFSAIAAHARPAASTTQTPTTSPTTSTDSGSGSGSYGTDQSNRSDQGGEDQFEGPDQGGDQGFQAPPDGAPSDGGGRRGHAGSGGS